MKLRSKNIYSRDQKDLWISEDKTITEYMLFKRIIHFIRLHLEVLFKMSGERSTEKVKFKLKHLETCGIIFLFTGTISKG